MQVCASCSNMCIKCLSSQFCIICQPNSYLFNQSCYSSCPVKNYGDTNSWTCQACPYDCRTCNSAGNCLDCDGSEKRIISTITPRCVAQNSYYDNKTFVCPRCPATCSLCSFETLCMSCVSGYYLMDGSTCLNACPPRYFS